MQKWTIVERALALERAEREGVDLLIVGGGIMGAGILRDAAFRGLKACLVERNDFASGTSSRSSKLIHGGLRYIADGRLYLTRILCEERDRMRSMNPNLIKSVPFVFPVFDDSKMSMWKGRAMLLLYSALANFRPMSRFKILKPEDVPSFSRDLRREGLRGAGLYSDGCIDDARLVLETLKSAREMGCEAVNYAEFVGPVKDGNGRVVGGHIWDKVADKQMTLRCHALLNATGPKTTDLETKNVKRRGNPVRFAKGVHLVIPRNRLHVACAFAFEGLDGRYLFVVPWDDAAVLGTTDSPTDTVEEPVVNPDEVAYLLESANRIFPGAALTPEDLWSVYAGIRPVLRSSGRDNHPSSLSREERILVDPSGVVSIVGGKLTNYRPISERAVNRALRYLPKERRPKKTYGGTSRLPLRKDLFDRDRLIHTLADRYGIDPWRAEYLVRTYGENAERLLFRSPPELRQAIGASRYLYAEIPWALAAECPVTLCDLLERRIRMAVFAKGQGLAELDRIGAVAGSAAGWRRQRIQDECRTYADVVRRQYRVHP